MHHEPSEFLAHQPEQLADHYFVTMTEAVSWLALERSLTPARWRELMSFSSRHRLTLALIKQELAPKGLLSDPKASQGEIADLEKLSDAHTSWVGAIVVAVSSVSSALLQNTHYGHVRIWARALGAARVAPLSAADFLLPILFNPNNNSLEFDARQAREVASSFTLTDTTGWTDVCIPRADTIALKKLWEKKHSSKVVSKASAETACGKWLAVEMSQPPKYLRGTYFQMAKERWSELSERAFDRAWGNAALESPHREEWRKTGPKPHLKANRELGAELDAPKISDAGNSRNR
jgi:hypothetical protein